MGGGDRWLKVGLVAMARLTVMEHLSHDHAAFPDKRQANSETNPPRNKALELARHDGES